MNSLKPYQQKLELELKSNPSYAELSLHKKRTISVYFNELEQRMWNRFASEKWSKDVDKDASRSK